MSQNGVNNGFLCFHDLRIPRENMLMKNSKVLEDGTYIKAPNDKLIYGPMIFTRVLVVLGSYKHLSKAVVIATRYSIVRKQGRIHEEYDIYTYHTILIRIWSIKAKNSSS